MTRKNALSRGKNPASHGNVPTARKHYRWKPGGSVASNGYVKIRVGKDHPLADPNGYAYEHTVIWCAAGREKPPKGWLIHHKNEDKTDNRIGNLEMKKRGVHNSEHLRAESRRCPKTGRLLSKARAGRLLDGVTHDGFPA
jgi:hypothetical protein